MKKLTQARLKELLHYDSETGIFKWKVKLAQRVKIGDIAGSDSHGYIGTGIEGVLYLNHRLAWLYVYGYFPENEIDHKDKIRYHNWISNLREATPQCNQRNTGNPKNNISGVKGVCRNKKTNKWQVKISLNNQTKYIGEYESFNEAVCTRLATEQCLDWNGCDSNSPAYQYVQNMLSKPKKKRKLPKIIV